MPAGSIIKHLHVVEDIGTSELASLVDTFSDALLFQAAEEGFSDGIIPAVAAPAHAGF